VPTAETVTKNYKNYKTRERMNINLPITLMPWFLKITISSWAFVNTLKITNEIQFEFIMT